MARMKKPKYKVDDMVYSWQNPTIKRRVSHRRLSTELGYSHQYKVALVDSRGYGRSSKWMGEGSLSKRRKR